MADHTDAHFDYLRFSFKVQKWMNEHGYSIRTAAEMLELSKSSLHRLLDEQQALKPGGLLHVCKLLKMDPMDFYMDR